MGEVYLAQHPRLPRKDALKVLAADVSANEEYRVRFGREADLASTLWHPNVVGVHDRGEDDGQLWISMDYVDGLDARRLLTNRFPDGMPAHRVANIVTAVASALDYAHDQGLLHRDVKPANIMLTTDEQRILLADFGIARSLKEVSSLTATGFTVGTVAYAAPEQLMGQELDNRTDQYALAATAYHLLTGSQLFPHSNPAVVVGRQLNANPPPLGDARPELAAFDHVLATGLAKNPEDRFSHCKDFARALASALDEAAAPSTTRTLPATPTPAKAKPSAARTPAKAKPPAAPTKLATPTPAKAKPSTAPAKPATRTPAKAEASAARAAPPTNEQRWQVTGAIALTLTVIASVWLIVAPPWHDGVAPLSPDAIAPPEPPPPNGSGPPPPPVAKSTIDTDGIHKVGTDITPGTYRSDGGTACYWARLRSLDTNDIIDSSANHASSDPPQVEIAPGDAAFFTKDCGAWHKTD